MSHTYCCSLFHCVFSTKERCKSIAPEIQPRLWAYMGGIAREHEMKALGIGGMDDHAHILLSLSTSQSIATAMREIKSGSSRWMHETAAIPGFEWQEGYGAFSIGSAQVNTTLAYIARQQEHHRKRDFRPEFIAFLKKHGIEYDPRYVWG
jgi:REP element-mobilizing transposase RayT